MAYPFERICPYKGLLAPFPLSGFGGFSGTFKEVFMRQNITVEGALQEAECNGLNGYAVRAECYLFIGMRANRRVESVRGSGAIECVSNVRSLSVQCG